MNKKQRAARVLTMVGYAKVESTILTDEDIERLAEHCDEEGVLTGAYDVTCHEVVRDRHQALKTSNEASDKAEEAIATTQFPNAIPKIAVQGARMTSTITAGTEDGSLEKDWSKEDEANYRDAEIETKEETPSE